MPTGLDGGGYQQRDLTEDFCEVTHEAGRSLRISQIAELMGESSFTIKHTAEIVEDLGECVIDRTRNNWLITMVEREW